MNNHRPTIATSQPQLAPSILWSRSTSWVAAGSAFILRRLSQMLGTRGIPTIACIAFMGLTACTPPAPSEGAPILLFNGTGTSPNDVRAIEAVLNRRRLNYATVDSHQLNGLSDTQMMGHRLLIVPGGNYLTIASGLTSNTATNIHRAMEGGLNYLGICAGGLLAGNATTNSPNLTAGVRVGFYAVVNKGIHKAAVPIAIAGAPTVEHYWEDGPQFTGWGEVVGKYPDGTPAIVQGSCGKGWVVLCGVHPEAPESWRRGMPFNSPANMANDYAATLIEAALNGTRLPHD